MGLSFFSNLSVMDIIGLDLSKGRQCSELGKRL